MDLRQAMKWRPDNAYRAAVATPRLSAWVAAADAIELASIGDKSLARYSPGSARPPV